MLTNIPQTLTDYTFIDLFAGIGGFHLALSSFGATCVFASEWDSYSAETYFQNFKLQPHGDITKINSEDIPKHNILCAGFPCQAFSISGKQRGFEDTRGTLFFEIARIVSFHRPDVLLLENVKNLISHNNGETMSTIYSVLTDLGYTVHYTILNSSDFGLPQNRERVYIVGFKNELDSQNFKFPEPLHHTVTLNDVLEEDPHNAKIVHRNDINIYKEVSTEVDLFGQKILYNRPIQIGIVNKGGQGERIYHPTGHTITLSAHGGGVGAKTGLYLINNTVRKLSPRECARVQGFPDSFRLHHLDSQSYKQFGNSVSVDVLQYIVMEIAAVLHSQSLSKTTV